MQYLTFVLDHTAGTDNAVYVNIPIDMTLDSVAIIPNAATAANGTNFVTVAVRDAADSADLFSVNTSSTGFTAGTALTVTLSGDLDYDADEAIKVSATDDASGASCNLQVVVGLVPRRSV